MRKYAMILMFIIPSFGLAQGWADSGTLPTKSDYTVPQLCSSTPTQCWLALDANNYKDYLNDLRTAVNRIRDGIINVKYYGAAGDGVADDTAEIQAAIDAAELVKGIVFLPPGTYKISSTLTIDNRITFRGAGMGRVDGSTDKAATILSKTNAANAAILVTGNADYTLLEEFGVDGPWPTALTGAGIVIGVDGNATFPQFVTMRRIFVKHQGGSAFVYRNGNSGTFEDIAAEINGGHGIDISSPTSINSNSHYLRGVKGWSNGGDGLHIDVSTSNIVTGCDFEGNTGWGIYVNRVGNMIQGHVEGNTSGALYVGVNAFDCVINLRHLPSETVSVNNANNWINTLAGAGTTPMLSPTGNMTIRGTFSVEGLPVHADNAAAISAGLAVGRFYRTSTGVVMVRY